MEQTKNRGLQYYQKIIIILVLGWIALWIYRTIMSPIYPQIQASLGNISDAQMGLVASIYFFAYTGTQIPSGILVDKFGQKKVLVPAFIIFAIGAVIIGTSTTIMQVYMGSVVAGMATGSYYGAAYSLSAKYVPTHKKSFANAIINSGTALGMIIGLVGSSVLVAGLKIQWNYMLFLAAGIIILTGLVFILVIKRDVREQGTINAASSNDTSSKTIVEYPSSLFTAKHIATYFVYFATCYGYYMIVTWLPSFLVEEKGFQQSSVGYVAALVAVSAIPAAIFFSRYIDSHAAHQTKLIVFLLIAGAVTLSLTVFAGSPIVLYIALLLYGLFGKLAIDPVLITFITESAHPKALAKALGTYNFFGMLSSILAPLVTGYIGDITGSKVLGFYIATALLVIAALLFFVVVMTRKREV